jgi:asparagine synthase (glutamine-hydrolysing)
MFNNDVWRRYVDMEELAKLAALRMDSCYFLRGSAFSPPERVPIAAADDDLPKGSSGLDRRLYRMFHCSVLPTILRNFDRLSMAHGVEVRMPFMDWRLVTYTLALPSYMKVTTSQTKIVARDAMAGLMPETIRTGSRKVGFNSQMPFWLNGKLGQWSERLLSTPHDVFDAVVDRTALRARVTELTYGGRWTWTSAGRLWPYINMKWYLDRKCP